MIYPPALKKGDTVAIISPASPVKEEYIDGARDFLLASGYGCRVMPHAKGPASGSFASSRENRLSDFRGAWMNPKVRAVLCARGGYGAVHLLKHITPELLNYDPKWLIGFSDISALHAMLVGNGIVSLHAPMAKHLTERPADDEATVTLMNILSGGLPATYEIEPDPLNQQGEAEGVLVGGNLAVLHGLSSTPYDLLRGTGFLPETEKLILFIEDISEAIYAVERMLYRLLLAGAFSRVSGLIVGRFTEYRPDRNFNTMEEMISAFLKSNGLGNLPAAFGFPTGHVDRNLPLAEGSRAHLSVTPTLVTLTQS